LRVIASRDQHIDMGPVSGLSCGSLSTTSTIRVRHGWSRDPIEVGPQVDEMTIEEVPGLCNILFEPRDAATEATES
jgi:hypothetical protein